MGQQSEEARRSASTEQVFEPVCFSLRSLRALLRGNNCHSRNSRRGGGGGRPARDRSVAFMHAEGRKRRLLTPASTQRATLSLFHQSVSSHKAAGYHAVRGFSVFEDMNE